MAHLFNSEKVQYLCSCGSLKPLCSTYFCRHCLTVKCGECVFHEVDIHYCSTCIENVPQSEARLKKNLCGQCFECPLCDQTLLTRATNIQVPSTEDPSKMIPKKMFYLACGFCRWSTREAGLPDQPVATGSWPENVNPHAGRIASLLEHYQSLAQLEKFEKEVKRQQKRRSNYLSFTADKYSLGALVARKRSGVPFTASFGLKKEVPQVHVIEPSVPLEEVDDELDEEIFTRALDISSVTTIEQRLRQPHRQPREVRALIPNQKHLSIRRSQRCRVCEHNLSKPEYNPSSIRFKIHLGGFYHIPEVMIYRVLKTDMQLRLSNRGQYPCSVRLVSIEEFIRTTGEKIKTLDANEDTSKTSNQLEAYDSPRFAAANLKSMMDNVVKQSVNSSFQLPAESIALPARDDLTEYEISAPVNLKDDPKCLLWRRGNKAVLSTPLSVPDTVAPAEEKRAGFVLEFGAIRAGFETKETQPQPVTVYVPVFLSLGTL